MAVMRTVSSERRRRLADTDGMASFVDDELAAPPLRMRGQPATEFGSSATAAWQRRLGAPRGLGVAHGGGDRCRQDSATGDPRRAPPARQRARRGRRGPGRRVVRGAAGATRPSRVRDPEHHLVSGPVAVTIGPFGDLEQIGEFADALSSIPGGGSMRIRTFEGASVVYDLELDEPANTIDRLLRGRSHRPLRLLHANERVIRLKLV